MSRFTIADHLGFWRSAAGRRRGHISLANRGWTEYLRLLPEVGRKFGTAVLLVRLWLETRSEQNRTTWRSAGRILPMLSLRGSISICGLEYDHNWGASDGQPAHSSRKSHGPKDSKVRNRRRFSHSGRHAASVTAKKLSYALWTAFPAGLCSRTRSNSCAKQLKSSQPASFSQQHRHHRSNGWSNTFTRSLQRSTILLRCLVPACRPDSQ